MTQLIKECPSYCSFLPHSKCKHIIPWSFVVLQQTWQIKCEANSYQECLCKGKVSKLNIKEVIIKNANINANSTHIM